MRRAFFVYGVFQVGVQYLSQKNGVFWYYRRVPKDVRAHHGGKDFIRKSLQTRDPHVAAKKVAALAAADDAVWKSLRSPTAQDLGLTTQENRRAAETLLASLGLAQGDAYRPKLDGYHVEVFDQYFEGRYGARYLEVRYDPQQTQEDLERLFTPVEREAVRLVLEDPQKHRVLLTDALEVYLKNHDKGGQEKFARDTRRAVQHVIASVGDLPLEAYRREHANAVRDFLLARGGKTGTVRRDLNRIKAVFNVGLTEFDLWAIKSPFEKLRIVNEDQDAEKREPFTTQELQAINQACHERNDDIRHIIALQADTGARLGEIVGLRVEDVVLDHATPHIYIRPYPKLGRTLKTDASERRVPLVGMALWAAQKAVEAAKRAKGKPGWLFLRYASDGDIKSTNAANAINKWLRAVTKTDKTSHSFRHTMRDRMRHVGMPSDIQDAIGGWGTKTVGMGYGEGYRLEQLKGWLGKVVLD
ncbi:MAG TPA: tyrosine-type recombinase/integrase [Microvirga sp.]|nr:tyrosine-type recombinase/integrase [Microvirga sp.]